MRGKDDPRGCTRANGRRGMCLRRHCFGRHCAAAAPCFTALPSPPTLSGVLHTRAEDVRHRILRRQPPPPPHCWQVPTWGASTSPTGAVRARIRAKLCAAGADVRDEVELHRGARRSAPSPLHYANEGKGRQEPPSGGPQAGGSARLCRGPRPLRHECGRVVALAFGIIWRSVSGSSIESSVVKLV